MVFRNDPASKGRARGDDDKAKVRLAFVAAGRHLLATEDPAKVSLRRIAAAAGYSPGSIYSYFPDARALYRAVRERDMEEASAAFEQLLAAHTDPEHGLRHLMLGTVQYWLSHADHFDILFAMPGRKAAVADDSFGQSAVVLRALAIYDGAVQAYFDSLPRHPMPIRLASDALLAAVYGMIAFPRMTQTMPWSALPAMAGVVVDAMLAQWRAAALKM